MGTAGKDQASWPHPAYPKITFHDHVGPVMAHSWSILAVPKLVPPGSFFCTGPPLNGGGLEMERGGEGGDFPGGFRVDRFGPFGGFRVPAPARSAIHAAAWIGGCFQAFVRIVSIKT